MSECKDCGGIETAEACEPACPHQWFEVKKMKTWKDLIDPGTKKPYGKQIDKEGVLVKCVNCLTSKELWE